MSPAETLNAIAQLAAELRTRNADLHTQVTSFSSGSAMLDVKRNGHGWVLAYSPSHGFGVDKVESTDGIDTHFNFVAKDFHTAARRLVELTAQDTAPPSISLVTVYSRDIEKSKDFYSQLGLDFDEEKHGAGPRHYAATTGAAVLEIYPAQGTVATSRIGFCVSDLDNLVERLRGTGTRIVRDPTVSPWGRRAVIEDPDGNKIELSGR